MYFSKVVSSVSLCHKISTSKVRGLPIAVSRHTTLGHLNWLSVSQPECSAYRVGSHSPI